MIFQNINGLVFLGILMIIALLILLWIINSLNRHYRKITDEYIELINTYNRQMDKYIEMLNALEIIAIGLKEIQKEQVSKELNQN